MPVISIPARNQTFTVPEGTNLLEALREQGLFPDAPCGGNGKCGKCRVFVDGAQMLACRTPVHRDMTVALAQPEDLRILEDTPEVPEVPDPLQAGYLLAFDIGTTSLVCFLMDGKTGQTLAQSSMQNPQTAFGADVISRIQAALRGSLGLLTDAIRGAMTELIQTVCAQAGISPGQIGVVSVVGNPAMQQLLLGISPENLAAVPFSPVITQAKAIPCPHILPVCPRAQMLIVADIAGFLGADTVGCLLSTGLFEKEEVTLLLDIGTNGEMVLGSKNRMVACAAAAGPALEGGNIQFGMRATTGAIDHVWTEKGEIVCSVIGGGEAGGICGSGLIDAVAVGLKLGLINRRGRILTQDHTLPLTGRVYLTQEDVRQVQLAKGAIRAGISLMAESLGIGEAQIQRVLLAGAFGSFLNPENACRIGLLPEELLDRIQVVGNAAGSGAKMLARNKNLLPLSQKLAEKIAVLELASLPAFPKTFARAMGFREEDPLTRWLERASAMGFHTAVAMDPRTLVVREDIRAMCAQDKCGAYDKNWTCPPAIGTVSQCQETIGKYRRGILLQTVGHTRKAVDTRCYRETERRHLENFHALAQAIRTEFPQALCLGSGACRVCSRCAYPHPCRFPEKAVSSMEGYGLFVTQVCRDAGVPYHYGEKTITYTACILF